MVNEPRDEFLEWVRETHEVFSRQDMTGGARITLSETCVRRLFADAQQTRAIRLRSEFEKFGDDPCTHVLRLLQNTQISVGKACEWLRHYIHNDVRDPLPEENPPVHVDPTGNTREPPHCPTCSCGVPHG